MRITIAGLHQHNSGLSGVMMALACELGGRNDVTLLGFEPGRGMARTEIGGPLPITVVPAPYGRFDLGDDLLRAMTDGCDAILVIGPAFISAGFLKQIDLLPKRRDLRVVLYLPTEGSIVSPSILDVVTLADACVLYTASARDDVANLMSKHPAQRERHAQTSLHVVGHGVDFSDFHPLSWREDLAARHVVRKTLWATDDPEEICALVVARPHLRKRLDLAISGFSLHALRHGRTRLVLHAGTLGDAQEADLLRWIKQGGASGRISILSPEPMTRDRLNQIYNACDIGLSTAMGEGWGLPLFEHAATGGALVVPDHTGLHENWHHAAVMLPSVDRHRIFFEYSDMHSTSPEHVADALDDLATNPARLRETGIQCALNTRSERYRWSKVADEMELVLRG